MIKIAASIATIGSVIGLAFGAWFTITSAIAETETSMEQTVELVRQEASYGNNEDAIWRTQHQLEAIEERREADKSYSWDERREKQLVRAMDILLRKQEAMLDKYEILSK